MRLQGWILAVGLCLLTGSAFADNRSLAREAYKEGTRQFEIGEYKAALENFKKAYVAYEEAAFLFNMAQCQRLLGEKPEALRSYRLYLRKIPNSPNRAEIENVISSLEAAIEQDKTATALPPTGVDPATGKQRTRTTAEPPPFENKPAEAISPPAAVETAPPPPQPQVVEEKPAPKKDESTPLYKKWWLWTAVGGVVVVAVAVGVGVAASTPNNAPTPVGAYTLSF